MSPTKSKPAAQAAGLSLDEQVGLLRAMLEIRRFEDECHRLFAQGLVRGSTHLGQGQEAVAGVLTIVAPAGATVAVGAPIATIGGGGVADTPAPAAPSAPADPAAAATAAPPRPARAAEPSASPIARRTAAALGVALDTLAGSGRHGRIVRPT